MREALPIDSYVTAIVAAVREQPLVVVRAEPGSGKTTRLPPALLELCEQDTVLVVEPRRLAAVGAAARVASECGEEVGVSVGYRVRHEQKGGPQTRLWYATDGMVLRDLLHRPFMEGVRVLVLDEFHERRLGSDVLLAVARFLQQTVRPELRIVLLSATIAAEELRERLGTCAVVDCPGARFPVRTVYAGERDGLGLASLIRAIQRAFTEPENTGDVLVFLPGVGEIRATARALSAWAEKSGLELVPLHGGQSLDEQYRVFQRPTKRRVILATNIAESSLTVPGVTAVVDSGLAREAYFDRSRGLNTLRLVKISQASADQRKARAGRTAEGVCVRLGTAAEFATRRPYGVPEILRVDLADVLLQIAVWGWERIEALPWLDPPPPASLQTASMLLERLGALNRDGSVTELGQRLVRFPVEVRIARWLDAASEANCAEEAAFLAALWVETAMGRTRPGERTAKACTRSATGSDLLDWAEEFIEAYGTKLSRAQTRTRASSALVERVERTRREFCRYLGRPVRATALPDANSPALAALLAAYPDRLCRARAGDPLRGTMVGGMGVRLSPQSAAQGADWFVALEVEWPQAGTQREALVRVASAISFSWIERWLPNALNVQREVRFDERAQRVVIEERRQVFDLLAEAAMRPAEVGPEAAAVLFAALAHEPEKFLRIDRKARELALRLRYLGRLGLEGFEAFSDLRDTWREVLRIVCSRCTSVREVVQADPGAILWSMLSASLRRVLESEAPSHVTLPNGRSRPLDYETDRPQLALRIQEAFGWGRTPVIGSRNVPVALCLLAPNGRPVQVTTDLASFWQNAYPQIRRELSRRYPRHAWPEDPMIGSSAPPSSVRANRR